MQLIDAAQALFETGGADAMSFRAIAQAAGCSHAKPYSYFDNKADLIDQLRVRSYQWLRDVIAVAASGAPDPVTALEDMARAYVLAAAERPRMYELLYTDQGAMDEDAPELIAAKLDAIGVCEGVIAAAGTHGDLRFACDPKTTAHLFWAAAHGLTSLHNDGFLVVGRSLDDLLPHLFASLIAGQTIASEDR